MESLGQGKDQFEGDMSQLSERSVSSPTTQTPSSSPALKAGCFKPENLIHTSEVCLKLFPHQ